MFQNFGIWDGVIVLVVVLVLFGGKRLPELAKSLAKAITGFKKGLKEGEDDIQKDLNDHPNLKPK